MSKFYYLTVYIFVYLVLLPAKKSFEAFLKSVAVIVKALQWVSHSGERQGRQDRERGWHVAKGPGQNWTRLNYSQWYVVHTVQGEHWCAPSLSLYSCCFSFKITSATLSETTAKAHSTLNMPTLYLKYICECVSKNISSPFIYAFIRNSARKYFSKSAAACC